MNQENETLAVINARLPNEAGAPDCHVIRNRTLPPSRGFSSRNNNKKNRTPQRPIRMMSQPRITETTTTDQYCESLPVSEFLQNFRTNSAHFISAAYLLAASPESSTLHRSILDGSLSTTLVDDVFCLVHAQLALLDEYLVATKLAWTDTGDAVVTDALLSILRILCGKQVHYYSGCCGALLDGWNDDDMDACIARANDFWTMGERIGGMMQGLAEKEYEHLAWNVQNESPDEWETATNLVTREATRLMDRLNADAVEASHQVAICAVRSLQRLDIPREFFGRHWEEDLVHNEVATYICRVYANTVPGMRASLVSDCLYHKVLVTLARCTLCFYLKSFLRKADRIRRSNPWYDTRKASKKTNQDFFRNPKRALLRMGHDIDRFEDYFRSLSEGSLALSKIVAHEFSSFRGLFLEGAGYAVGRNKLETLREFVLVLHKRTGADADVTRHFLSDVFLLMGNKEINYAVRDTVRSMKDDLDRIHHHREGEAEIKNGSNAQERNDHSDLFRLDAMLQSWYRERILQEKTQLCGTLRTRI